MGIFGKRSEVRRGWIEQPAYLDGIFCSVAAGVAADPESIGMVVLGISYSGMMPYAVLKPGTLVPPVVILDYGIEELTPENMEATIPQLERRMSELSEQIATDEDCVWPTFVTPEGSGASLYEQARWAGYNVAPFSQPEQMAKPVAERVIGVLGRYVGAGHVKLTRDAFKESFAHHGVTGNHLVRDIETFGTVPEKQRPGVLLTALADGLIEAFADERLRSRTARRQHEV